MSILLPQAPLVTVPMTWQTTRHLIDLSAPKIMGIVNVTPDSFSDGSTDMSHASGIARARAALDAGADILDIGAESTRPGASPLSQEMEWARLHPVLQEVLQWGVPVSVDTYKPAVMQRALDMGVDIINDVWALRWHANDGLLAGQVIGAHNSCGVCLMHMNGEPATMQVNPVEGDLVHAVADFLHQHAQALVQLGVERHRIVLDPGIGFGKTVAQNFSLLGGQRALLDLGFAVLAGWSRKSSLGAVTGRDVGERVCASVAAAVLAVCHGASVVRVHDVAATKDALAVVAAARAAAPVAGTA